MRQWSGLPPKGSPGITEMNENDKEENPFSITTEDGTILHAVILR